MTLLNKHLHRYCIAMALCLAVLSLSSCNSNSVASMIQASGKPGEVMLVMNAADLESQEAYKLLDLLEVPAPALPQEEATLRVTSRVSHENFNSIMLRARNIFLVDIDPARYSKSTLKIGYDEWAKGQLVLTLNTPSRDSLLSYAREEQELIRNIIIRHELFRFGLGVEDKYSSQAKHFVDSLFGYHINVPLDINKHKIGTNFLWMSNARMHARHDLMVYTFPYRRNKDLEIDRLIEVRDSVLKVNIPGGVAGSYPTTVKTGFGLNFRKLQLPGESNKRSELRGLWQMEGGDMMGGPFVLQAFHNETDNLVYVFEGFVYRPNEDKLNMVRTMEAALYSVRPNTAPRFEAKRILSAQYTKSF